MNKTKHQSIAIALLASLMFFACQDDQPDDPGQKIDFSLALQGDLIDFSESSLGRTTQDEEKTIYAIRVFTSSDNINESPYAVGMFDDLSQATIGLYENRNYNFIVEAYRGGTAYGLAGYDHPDGYQFYSPYWDLSLTNSFEFSTDHNHYSYNGVEYWTDDDSLYTDYSYWAPEIDTYVGELFVDPSGIVDNTIEIDTKRNVFGLEATVENCTEGEVVIRLGDYEDRAYIMTPENPSLPLKIFSIRDDMENYEEVYLNLSVAHIVNNSMNVIYDKSVQFNRMTIKNLNITLCEDCNDETSTGVRVNLEEKDWDTETIDING